MAWTTSRSAFPVTLEISEIEALIEWHRNEEYRFADRSEYSDAASCKQRREFLEQAIKERREVLRTEALEITKKNLAQAS